MLERHCLLNKLIEGLDKIRRKHIQVCVRWYSPKDSFEFVQKLEIINACDKFVVSFDLSSLFAKVPLEEMAEVICQYPEHLPLSSNEFKRFVATPFSYCSICVLSVI